MELPLPEAAHLRFCAAGPAERLGFGVSGETQPFPHGDERFALPRRPDLQFAVLAKSLA